jgi:hypothetical protein
LDEASAQSDRKLFSALAYITEIFFCYCKQNGEQQREVSKDANGKTLQTSKCCAYLDGDRMDGKQGARKKGWNVGALKAIARVTLPSISSFPLAGRCLWWRMKIRGMYL